MCRAIPADMRKRRGKRVLGRSVFANEIRSGAGGWSIDRSTRRTRDASQRISTNLSAKVTTCSGKLANAWSYVLKSLAVAGDVLIQAAGPDDVHSFVNVWVPFDLIKKLTDTTWNYRKFPLDQIIALGMSDPTIATFAAKAGAHTEGLLAIERVRNATKLKVAFLATAPWNYGQQKQRSGIGSGLLAYAVQLSKDGGFAGVELSSTPESETFYERMGWRRTGRRDHEQLNIFELHPDHVDGFLARHPTFPFKVANVESPKRTG